jgi:hypothetical protein
MSRTWFVTGATGSGSTLPTPFLISCTGFGEGDVVGGEPPPPGVDPPPPGEVAGGLTWRTGAGEDPGDWPVPGVVGAPGAAPPAGPPPPPAGAPAAGVAGAVLGTALVTATFLDALAEVPVVPVSGRVGPEKAWPTEPRPPTPPPSATAAATASTPTGAASERPVAPAVRRSHVEARSMEPW